MGWKSTVTISRKEAIAAIINEMSKLSEKSNQELEDMMHGMFGDDTELPYYGCNFDVRNTVNEED